MTIRKTVVAGQFYPNNSHEIDDMFTNYNKILDENIDELKLLDIKPKAIIVPHAGYIYSGFTANIAYRVLKNSEARCVVVIGPSHHAYINGISISDYERYETPFGDLPIDETLINELKTKFNLYLHPDAHFEHSTEVQMPFIKHYLPNTSVVELVYGKQIPSELAEIIDFILDDPRNLVVISTDLSHYYDIKKANILDNICLDAVEQLDISKLHQGCEACGRTGVEAMLICAKQKGLRSILLDYRTSADTSGDKNNVVGYMSAAFVK
ncbi:MAG: AmmeMemoRadiSam system protein B [Sulfurospirillaceae bacterium]|nr:AmmeMemoRadiSam system protein B [Sulfurospirillaceae bacterium]